MDGGCRWRALSHGAAISKTPTVGARIWGAIGLALFLFALAAPPAAAQPVFNSCQNDVQGANDVPGQKDLTRFCVEPGTSPFEVFTQWDWDLVTLPGGNTGDACSLYDTDADGNANLVVCVTIRDGGLPATLGAVRLFTCSDTRPDRCTGSVQIAGNQCAGGTNPGASCTGEAGCFGGGACMPGPGKNTTCSVSQQPTDPFPAGEDFPIDTVATCSVDLADFGAGTSATLIDACSLPSTVPNSAPADCVLFKACTLAAQCDDSNPCTSDTCDTSIGACRHTPATGTTCNDGQFCTVTDTCNSLGFCDGSARDCSDSNGCTADSCNETLDTCVNDGAAANGSACGNPGSSACDAPDSCFAGVCQPNFVAPGTACGSSSDTVCDNPDTCNGTGSCQTNNEPNGTTCGDAGTQCVNQDTCQGGMCQDNGFKVAGTACGSASDTVCDNPDTCNASGACQANNEPGTSVCRADAGACDVAESCAPGGVCPADSFEPAGTACGGSAADCDALDTCNASGTCVDNVDPATTVCRADAGACDVEEKCNGTTKVCPADSFEPGGTVCRASAGDCDPAENCTGTSAACPPDALDPASTVCRPAVGQCDVAENCTGSSAACPDNEFASNTTACDDGLSCTVQDHCTGTDPIICAGTERDCDDTNVCSTDVCNEVSDRCEHTSSVPPCEGKMTGGGQILVNKQDKNDKRSFGFNAKGTALVPLGLPGGPRGQFNYVNHKNRVHINGPVTFIYYAIPSGNGGEMMFQVTTLTGCTYNVTTKDQVEPGSKPPYDFLTVEYMSGSCPAESTGGAQRLNTGNIQWHNQ